jgi:hypothetical protein
VRSFKIDRLAQEEFDEAAAWYEHQEIGLGFEFIEEVDRVLVRIEKQETFVTAPLIALEVAALGHDAVIAEIPDRVADRVVSTQPHGVYPGPREHARRHAAGRSVGSPVPDLGRLPGPRISGEISIGVEPSAALHPHLLTLCVKRPTLDPLQRVTKSARSGSPCGLVSWWKEDGRRREVPKPFGIQHHNR